MNKFLKKIHLYISIVITFFCFLYLITGLIISFPELFKKEYKKTETIVTKDIAVQFDTINSAVLVEQVKQNLPVHGRLMKAIHESSKKWNVEIYTPGTYYKVGLDFNTMKAEIKTSDYTGDLFQVIREIHKQHGFREKGPYFWYGVLVDVIAVSFMLFAITGVIMWWNMRKSFKAGLWFILPGVVVTVVVIIALFI